MSQGGIVIKEKGKQRGWGVVRSKMGALGEGMSAKGRKKGTRVDDTSESIAPQSARGERGVRGIRNSVQGRSGRKIGTCYYWTYGEEEESV